MKRIGTGAAILVLALATAACGGSEQTSDAGTTAEPATSEAAAPDAAEPVEAAAPAADVAAAGAATSAKPASFAQCAVCHVSEAGKAATLGPNLFGVAGRAAGTTEGFPYSQAMKDSGVTWDAAKLDAFLTSPQKVVPGTRMAFGGVADAAKRKEIVDYLMSLK